MPSASLQLASAVLLVSIGGGCATPRPIDPEDPSRPLQGERDDGLERIDVVALGHEVETVRRLTLKEPIHAQALDHSAFRERLFAQRVPSDGRASDRVSAVWAVFQFAPPSAPLGEISRRVRAEQVVGFYDDHDRTLFVRGTIDDRGRIVPETNHDQFTLAHEIEHALQHQSFDIKLDEVHSSDASLAYRALLEGDATLTEVAVRAQRRPDTEHWVSRVTKLLRSDEAGELQRRSGVNTKELDAAPPLLQRQVMFPYRDGFAFVADLYRAGGLKLVNRAFTNPPRSTEQVLHTDRYLVGDAPISVPAPTPPDGWTVVGVDAMGELATGVLLGQCSGRSAGAEGARGWGGDSYAVVGDRQGRTAILWSTVWDDVEAATRFEKVVSARADCLRANPLDAPSGSDVVVRREDRRVAYVQGLGPALGEVQAYALLATPVQVPPLRPPFGPVTVPPLVIPEVAFLGHGRFGKDTWASDELGMRMQVPEDFKRDEEQGLEASMKHPNAHAGFTMLMTGPGQETDQAFMRTFLAKARTAKWMEDQSLDYAAAGPMPVDGVAASAHTWRTTKGAYVTLAFLPACAEKATIVLVLAWAGLDGKLAIEDWARHFSRPAATSPVCTYLTQSLD